MSWQRPIILNVNGNNLLIIKFNVSFSRTYMSDFPPLAVVDKGCGALLLTSILTVCGWIPGVITAILFNRD